MNNYKIYYINNNLNKLEYQFESNEYKFFEYKYTNFSFDEQFLDIFEDKFNILIYFEDMTEEYLNRIIKLIEKKANNEYFNITIFNKIINSSLAIPLFFTNSNVKTFKKVLNIFPFEIAITVTSETTFKLVNRINKSIDVIRDMNEDIVNYKLWYQKKMKGGQRSVAEQKDDIDPKDKTNYKRFVFRIMETNQDNTCDPDTLRVCQKASDQTWWFKYYFSIPVCSYGRLSQSTGTCWCNVILNICFLTPAISTLLLQKFKENNADYKKYIQDKYKDFNDICDSDDKLVHIIYGLINIIIINKKKATTLDCNFVSEIAARIKGIGLYNDEFYYKTLDEKLFFGNNYNTVIGFYIFLENILIQNIDYVLIESNYFDSKLYKKYVYLLDKINNLSTSENSESEIFVNKSNKIKNLLEYGDDLIENKMSDFDNFLSIKWSDIIYNFKDFNQKNPPNIIIIPLYLINIKDIIYINDIEYKLQSASICFDIKSLNDTHSISGLYCNEKYYVYDSNNIISYCKWNKSIFNEYIDLLNNFYDNDNYKYNYEIEFAIYIKN